MTEKKICFVISPIGSEGSDTRKRSDITYEYIIKPIVEKFGYHLTRADYIKEPGIITSQIIDQIFESSLVIADLSDNNPNVFYELAIRHVTKKPYVQMMRSGQKIPFDITGLRTISFDIDLESASNAKKELYDQIESIENSKFNPDNPITSAIHQSAIKKMLDSGDDIKPDDFSKVVLESVSELRSIVLDLRSEFHNLKSFDNEQEFIAMKHKKMLHELDYEIFNTETKINNANLIIEKCSNTDDVEQMTQMEQALNEVNHQEMLLSNLMHKKHAILDASMNESKRPLKRF